MTGTFSDSQTEQLALIVDAVIEKRLKIAADAAAAQKAADAAAAAAAGPVVPPAPPLNPVTASPAELLANFSGAPAATQPLAAPGVNPLAGKPAYVRFPSVPQAVLLEIMSHKLAFKDLIKLDVAYSRISLEPVLSLTDGRLSLDNKVTSKHFASPSVMLNCFSVYFDVLTFHVGATMGFEASYTVSHGWHLLQRRILQYATTYKWAAIVPFMEEYYSRRVAEMLDGRYSGWWETENNLEAFWLAGNLLGNSPAPALAAPRTKAAAAQSTAPSAPKEPKSEQICFAFLGGKCATPCRNGRKHEKVA